MVDGLTLGFGGMLLVCIALVAVGGRRVLAARKTAAAAPPPDAGSALVAREVVDDEGERLGETVRVEGDEVILQHGGAFLAVPRSALVEDGRRLKAVEFHRAEAEARGEAWRKRQQDVMRYDEQGMPIAER